MAHDSANHLKSGSICAIVLVLTTVLTLYITVLWRSNSYFIDFAAEQEQYLRNQINYLSLQQYCIAFIKNNYETLMQSITPSQRTVEFPIAWPPTHSAHNTRIVVSKASNALEFRMQYQQGIMKRTFHAAIEKKETPSDNSYFIITQWQPNA